MLKTNFLIALNLNNQRKIVTEKKIKEISAWRLSSLIMSLIIYLQMRISARLLSSSTAISLSLYF